MVDKAAKGTWVEVHDVVLEAGQRAPKIPKDTGKVPLEMRVKGFLNREAALGEQAEITTPAGRCLSGALAEINPPYSHGFGAPIHELSTIGMEVRAILRNRGNAE